MTWLITSPGHQQSWCWPHRIIIRIYLIYLWHSQCWKMQNMNLYFLKNLACNGLSSGEHWRYIYFGSLLIWRRIFLLLGCWSLWSLVVCTGIKITGYILYYGLGHFQSLSPKYDKNYIYRLADVRTGIILCMWPANERRRYNVTSPLICWTHTQDDPCIDCIQANFYQSCVFCHKEILF